MSLLRRDFLRLGLLPAIYGFTNAAKAEVFPQVTTKRQGLSIVQGATDDTHTQFSIVHAKGLKLSLQVTNGSGDKVVADLVETKGFTNMDAEVTRAFFSGLSPGVEFTLTAMDSEKNAMLDSRTFHTLDLQKIDLNFALVSCMNDKNHEPGIWQDMVKQNPDVIFFIGDCVYTDQSGMALIPSPDRLWRRFAEARNTLEIYYSKQLIPIFAVWDDHDFAGNDSWSDYQYVAESQKNFMTFFAQEESHCSILERGPGISSAWNLAGQLFLLLDDRSYRLRPNTGDRYSHWGQQQEEWALGLIAQHQGPTWFFNGTQIFPQMIFKESVSGDHKVQFEAIMQEIAKLNSHVVFGSGDVHFSEISQIEKEAVGYPTYELTSSGLHSDHFPGIPDVIKNDRRIYSTGEKNYLMINAKAQGMGVQMTVVCRSTNAQVNFTANLST